jgi:hypothetical protein
MGCGREERNRKEKERKKYIFYFISFFGCGVALLIITDIFTQPRRLGRPCKLIGRGRVAHRRHLGDANIGLILARA